MPALRTAFCTAVCFILFVSSLSAHGLITPNYKFVVPYKDPVPSPPDPPRLGSYWSHMYDMRMHMLDTGATVERRDSLSKLPSTEPKKVDRKP